MVCFHLNTSADIGWWFLCLLLYAKCRDDLFELKSEIISKVNIIDLTYGLKRRTNIGYHTLLLFLTILFCHSVGTN